MLDNTKTFQVDVANDATLVPQAYTRYDEAANRTTYIGEDHSLPTRNMLVVTRNFPTPSGNFKGVAKSGIKLTQDIEVVGADATTLTAPEILAINFSLPVGCTSAQVKELRQRAIAILDDDDFCSRLSEKLEV